MGSMSEKRRRLPPWLIGLFIAIVVFAAALVLFELLGFGDDPVLGSMPRG